MDMVILFLHSDPVVLHPKLVHDIYKDVFFFIYDHILMLWVTMNSKRTLLSPSNLMQSQSHGNMKETVCII